MSQMGVGWGHRHGLREPRPALLLWSPPPACAQLATGQRISGFPPWHFCKFSLDPEEMGSHGHGTTSGRKPGASPPDSLSHIIPTNISIHKQCNSWVCTSF